MLKYTLFLLIAAGLSAAYAGTIAVQTYVYAGASIKQTFTVGPTTTSITGSANSVTTAATINSELYYKAKVSLAITDLSYTVTTVINGCTRTVSVAYSGKWTMTCQALPNAIGNTSTTGTTLCAIISALPANNAFSKSSSTADPLVYKLTDLLGTAEKTIMNAFNADATLTITPEYVFDTSVSVNVAVVAYAKPKIASEEYVLLDVNADIGSIVLVALGTTNDFIIDCTQSAFAGKKCFLAGSGSTSCALCSTCPTATRSNATYMAGAFSMKNAQGYAYVVVVLALASVVQMFIM